MKRWRVPVAGVAAAVSISAFFFIGVCRPRSEKVAELKSDADQLRAEQAPLRRDIKSLEEVAAQETKFTVALERLGQLIPSGLAQPTLLADMQAAAELAGVEVVSVTFGDPKVPQGAPASPVAGTVLIAMPVTVVVDGSYAGIIDLLRRIEVVVNRAVLVSTVAITEAAAGFPRLTGTWSGQAYALLRADDPLLATTAPPASGAPSASSAPTTAPARRAS